MSATPTTTKVCSKYGSMASGEQSLIAHGPLKTRKQCVGNLEEMVGFITEIWENLKVVEIGSYFDSLSL